MKDWLSWIRKRLKDWPILISLAIFCLNIELVVTPHILKGIFGLSGRDLSISAGIWATVEMAWWVFFSRWLYKEKIRKIALVEQAIETGKVIMEDMSWQDFFRSSPKDTFLVRNLKNKILGHIRDFDIDHHQKDGAFMEIFGFAKGLGYFFACAMIFIFGLMPMFWIFGLMICRLSGWKMAYTALFTSNFIKNYWLAIVYEQIGFWWLLGAFVVMIIIVSFVVKGLVKVLRDRSQKNHL